jgi:septum formation protein
MTFVKSSPPPLLLASSSPRRKELLSLAGYQFEARGFDADEAVRPGAEPKTESERLARDKARMAFSVLEEEGEASGRLVLAADTLVSLNGLILGKPKDRKEAAGMLEALSDKHHEVHTGWCLKSRDFEESSVVSSAVRFRKLTAGDIDRYLEAGESMDKAGAYAIQGAGIFLVDWIAGSYPNIVGLPLAQIKAALDPALERLQKPSEAGG